MFGGQLLSRNKQLSDKMKWAYFLFLMLLESLHGHAQSWDFTYSHYGKNEGLPSNKIYFTCKDKLGFLWIGTDAGLCKYNGSRFEIFTTENGLPSNDVFELYCDSKNRIWIISMSNQVAYYYNGKIHNPDNDSSLSKIVVPDRVSRIVEDKLGNIWVLSFPFSINKISPSNNVEVSKVDSTFGNCFKVNLSMSGISFVTDETSFFYKYEQEKKLLSVETKRKKINDIVIVNDSLYYYTDDNNVLKKGDGYLWLTHFYTSAHVLSLFKTDKEIWKLGNNGISCYQINKFNNCNSFLKNYSVSNFVQDKYKNVWISTLYNGLFKLNSQSSQIFKLHNDETSNSFHSVLVNEKYIIIGNNNGEVSVIDRLNRNVIESVKINKNNLLSLRILKILIKGYCLFISSDAGTFTYNIKTGRLHAVLSNQSDKNIFFKGDSLIVLNNISVNYVNKKFIKVKELIKSDRFYSYCTYKGKSLFGSENTLYYENDSLIPYPLDQALHCRMMDMKVIDSLLVIATTEKGIFFINGNKVIENLNLERGLNSNNCSKIVPYKNELFVATNNGICRYNYHTKAISRIMESDGLASNNVLDLVLDHDTLYAGTDNGLSVIPVSSLTHRTSFSFFINPIVCNKDTTWDIVDSVNIHTDQPLSFTLNAISLGVKGNVTYFYRIKEQDTVFKSTSEPTMSFKLFNTGTYTFEAYSIDVNGLKSVMAALHVIVVPYWWQTWMFKFACVLVALIGLFLFHRFMTQLIRKREQAKSELKNKIIRLELDAWKSNINPHFMFNSFNAIQSMFASASYERANEFISNFASVLRKTIDNSGRLMNKFPEEIAYLTNILELERMKKMRKLSYQIFYDEQELDRYYIPSLLLQPIVENAVKHGVKHQRNGHIVIEFTMQSETITAIVRDNGVGLTDSKKDYTHSKGLKLVRDKIRIVESVTTTSIEFRIENVYGTNGECLGVAAIFVLPKFLEDDLIGFDVSV